MLPRQARDRLVRPRQVRSTLSLSKGNPFFIIPRQARDRGLDCARDRLVHPRQVRSTLSLSKGNPFFIRSVVPTASASSGLQSGLRFQSLLHQVSGANASRWNGNDGGGTVSIPSSSGQWCQRSSFGSPSWTASRSVSIPSSSGQWCQLIGAKGYRPNSLPVSIPSSSCQWCQPGTNRCCRPIYQHVSIPSSSGQWCQPTSPKCIVTGMDRFQSLLHQVSGANLKPRAASKSRSCIVSIPSSSGQWCQPCNSLCRCYLLRQRFNPFFIRSVVPTSNGEHVSVTLKLGFNPFFIRSVVPTRLRDIFGLDYTEFQSLLHQVSGANYFRCTAGSGHTNQFQSLLHQVSGANSSSARRRDRLQRVSIPSSSGQWCQPSFEMGLQRAGEREFQSLLHQVSGANGYWGRLPCVEIQVSIPSSSGQWCQHRVCRVRGLRKRLRFNPFFIRSVVPTERSGESPHHPRLGFNPFFIRSVVPTRSSMTWNTRRSKFQSLLHQVSGANQPSG